MLDLGLPESSFDAVVCVFGIFFEPGNTAFWDAVRRVAPDLHKTFNPWDRISDPQSVQRLLVDAGIEHSEARAERGQHPIPSHEAWWSAILGSGYSGTLERLDDQGRDHVRAANLTFIRDANIRSVEANVVHAVAMKAEA